MLSKKTWALLLTGMALAACAVAPVTPPLPPGLGDGPALPAATGSASVAVSLSVATPTPLPALGPGDEGIQATLKDYTGGIGSDPTGMKASAYVTLQNFANPNGPYSGSWWFLDDGRADISEVLAVILYTEGNTNWDVRTAVTARYLWYCAGTGSTCAGPALIDFLSYFQPWREPWNAPGFMSDHAQKYKSFAQDLIYQRSGLLTAMIPGADTYQRGNTGLSLAGPIDWLHTQFHFANVDPSWDSYLREQLHRLPNGPARLWVLTMGEAGRVCASEFVCEDMTRPRE